MTGNTAKWLQNIFTILSPKLKHFTGTEAHKLAIRRHSPCMAKETLKLTNYLTYLLQYPFYKLQLAKTILQLTKHAINKQIKQGDTNGIQ